MRRAVSVSVSSWKGRMAIRGGGAAMANRNALINAGFAAFHATQFHRLLPRAARGRGAILTFHHVRPFQERLPGYAPNRLLEITPEFLDRVLGVVTDEGFDLVSMDEALRRIERPAAKPFVVLTFDDAYKDNLLHALPILERHKAPFTIFVATGFAEGKARLWWLELEDAILHSDHLSLERPGLQFEASVPDGRAKSRAFAELYRALRAMPEGRMLDEIARLAAAAGVDPSRYARRLCMDWEEIAIIGASPLAEIGAHSVNHRMLAHWPQNQAREEMAASKSVLEAKTGRAIRHFAYPVGDPGSAALREFKLAQDCGFASAVTTRPGMLFAGHGAHRFALPRISVNGLWQSERALQVLLSGAPSLAWNCGRRLNVA